jgi:hypothetical protein
MKYCLWLPFLLSSLVFSNTEIIKVEVEGVGDSLQSAIDRGLTEGKRALYRIRSFE